MAQTMRAPSRLSTKDTGCDPKTPGPPSPLALEPSSEPPYPPLFASPARDPPPPEPSSPPQAQQSKKRKLAAPAQQQQTRFPHLPAPLPSFALAPPPPPPPPKEKDPLTILLSAYRGNQSRRAADITIAFKRREQSQEMLTSFANWKGFCKSEESARLDLLRAMDDAVAADREILRILKRELEEVLEVREKVGTEVDREVQEVAGGKRGKRVIGRPKRPWFHGVGMVVRKVLVLVMLVVAAVWVGRSYVL